MMFYFSLVPTLYAARFDDSVILLDSENDKYLSLIGPAALYFAIILENPFQYNDSLYLCMSESKVSYDIEQLNYWISQFLEKKFIKESTTQGCRGIALLPLKKGGLTEYQWDYKTSWTPFSKTTKYQIFKAFIELVRTHRAIKRKGIKGIIKALQETSLSKNTHIPREEEIIMLSSAVDAASLLYPKKTFCLAWAATFCRLASQKKWHCSFVIGIQTNPFYAHAWAEIAGKVINDSPQVAEVLSIILKAPTSKST